MRKRKLNKIALMLATATVATAIGGVLLSNNGVVANADEAKRYTLSTVFTSTGATVDAEENVTAFAISNNGSVKFKRNLAYKWQVSKDETKYLTVKFALKDTNFKTVDFTFETPSAWATKDDKAKNVVQIKKTTGDYVVSVNGNDVMTIASADISKTMTLSLSESATATDGEFFVNLKAGETAVTVTDEENCKFVNVGANYTNYSTEKYPLAISATIPTDATDDAKKTVVLLKEINGQSFDALENKEIVDNAAPVLVVNEAIDGFLLGSTFSLDYAVVDVLNTSIASADKKLTYYQYNPTKTWTADDYKTLDSSIVFSDTVYKLGEETTSVYAEEGAEYVSVKSKISDGYNSSDVDLSWYAQRTRDFDGVTYIPVDRNKEGAKYTFVTADENTKTNLFDETAYENAEATKAFKRALAEEASNVSSGKNAKLNIPSLKWFIGDNNGYRNLKFVISYKTPTSDGANTTSSLSYSALKLSVTDEGTYQFKVYATDTANNKMQYYNEEGELVDITSDNIWDFEEIPSFTFTIRNKGLSIDENKDKVGNRTTSVILDKTYTMPDIDVSGAENLKEKYALYKVDLSKYNAAAEEDKKLTQTALKNVSYADVMTELNTYKAFGHPNYTAYQTALENKDFFDLYLTAYAKLLATEVGADASSETVIENIKKCFIVINEYDERITEENAPTEWEAYNKYKWSSESQSFYTAEEGTYLIVADYEEKETPAVRIMGYKVISVESKADVIKGQTDWLKNNITSVILFSIAGVMLIAIIVLLLVKPSDETLKDVDAKVKEKKKNKK